jgi:TonB family protein
MYLRCLLFLLLLLPLAARAQSETTYDYVEQMPTFRGAGLDSLSYYIQRSLRYPAEARQQRLGGRVFVRFVLTPQGRVSEAQVVKGGHQALDAEAVRVLMALPAWEQPGRQHGQPVRVALTVPVLFQLQGAVPGGRPYDGPFFPFGPDSLRRFLAWGARHTDYPQLHGHYLVRLGLHPSTGQPAWETAAPLLTPQDLRATPDAPNALRQVLRAMPRWRPALAPDGPRSVTLAVYFGSATPSAALAYADFMPVFADGPGTAEALGQRLVAQLRRQQPALRGSAAAYVEVDETGRPANARLLLASRPALGTALLQAVQQLPQTLAPAQFEGRPVRVYYVVEVEL